MQEVFASYMVQFKVSVLYPISTKETDLFKGFLLAVIAMCTIGVGTQCWGAYRDVEAHLSRAQVSANAKVMADRLDVLLDNMEERDLTRGSTALIFRSSVNDLELIYQDLGEVRDRARLIEKLDQSSVEYQTGLDDMRGTLREIKIEARKAAFWYSPFTWIAIFLAIILSIIFFSEEFSGQRRYRY